MFPQAKVTNTNAIHIKKRSGTANNDGVDFENHMLFLVLLNLIEDDRVERFYIAQNMSEVGAFDDLVFLVEYKSGVPSPKLFLVQLKHTRKDVILAQLIDSTGSGNFSLLKYYKCFKTVISKVGNFKDVVLNKCQRLEDITFVLFTNATCLVGEDNFPKNSSCREILETGETASKIFKFNSSECFKKFYTGLKNSPIVNEDDGQTFLQQLVFFSGQSNTIDLKEKLKRRLEKYFIREDILSRDILHKAIQFVADNNLHEWLSSSCGAIYNISFNFQGISVEMKKFQKNIEFFRKIIVRHICQDTSSVGKTINKEEDYYIKRKVEYACSSFCNESAHNISDEKFVLLCAGPGMGKSWYLTHQAYLVKSLHKEKYVIRENLLDHCSYLNVLNIRSQNKDLAKQFLTELAGVKPGTVDFDLFQLCLDGDDEMVIFLDGLDEICSDIFDKVCIVIKVILAEFRVTLWVSTRPILRYRIKEYFEAKFWKLKRFSKNDAKLFLEKYCGLKDYVLHERENDLCRIPLFCRMLGDLIKSGDANMPNMIFNKVDLYDRFVENMYLRYYEEKEKGQLDIPFVNNRMEDHKLKMMMDLERAAVLAIFNEFDLWELNWDIEAKCERFLSNISRGFENIGLIHNIDSDGLPIFIHRSIAEYFCGRWFARKPKRYKKFTRKCRFYVEVNYFMSSKLDDLDPLFILVLNVKEKSEIENSLKQYIRKFNILDPLDRNVLDYANIVDNSNAARFILFNGFILKEEIVNLDPNVGIQSLIQDNVILRWLASMLKKYPHHGPLLSLILFLDKLKDDVPYFLMWYCKNSPLHFAILNQNKEDISKLIDYHVNCNDDLGLSALHLAVWMEDEDTVRLLVEKRATYSRRNILGVYPHQVLPKYLPKTEILKLLEQFYSDFMVENDSRMVMMKQNYKLQKLPLHHAVQNRNFRKYDDIYMNSCKHHRTKNLKEKISDHGYLKDFGGRSALHVMAANASAEEDVIQFLHLHELIKYTKDDDGYFPHHYAETVDDRQLLIRCGYKYIFKLLPTKDHFYKGMDCANYVQL